MREQFSVLRPCRRALDERVVLRGEIVDFGKVNLAVGLRRVEEASQNAGGGKEILQKSGEDRLLLLSRSSTQYWVNRV